MKPDSAHRTAAAEAAAARWMACHDRGMCKAERAAFEKWLYDDPFHEEQWRRAEIVWFELARLRSARNTRSAGLHPFTWMMVAASVVLASALFLRPGPFPTPSPNVTVFTSSSDTERRVELADGTVAIMRRGSRLSFGEYAQARRVRLHSGEVHFTVSKRNNKPFHVHAGPVAVRDIGTAFFIGIADNSVGVRVTEGRVEVSSSIIRSTANEPVRQLLDQGQQAVLPMNDLHKPPEASPRSTKPVLAVGEWKSRRLKFQRTPLAEVVDQLNLYNVRQIRLVDTETARLLISGALQSDNLDAFTRLLEDGFDLRVRQESEHSLAVGTR